MDYIFGTGRLSFDQVYQWFWTPPGVFLIWGIRPVNCSPTISVWENTGLLEHTWKGKCPMNITQWLVGGLRFLVYYLSIFSGYVGLGRAPLVGRGSNRSYHSDSYAERRELYVQTNHESRHDEVCLYNGMRFHDWKKATIPEKKNHQDLLNSAVWLVLKPPVRIEEHLSPWTDAKTAWTRDQSLLRSRTDRDHLNTFSVTEIDRTDGLRNPNFTGQRQTTTKAGLPENLRVQQIPMDPSNC